MKLIRTILKSITEGAIKRFTGDGRSGEDFTDREYLQHYGFTSRPINGAEGLALVDGNTVYLIASDDRTFRLAIADGEVALYTDEGDHIHFKRGNEIEIQSGGTVTITAAVDVTVTAPDVTVNAGISAKVISPNVILGAEAGAKSLATEDFVNLYNGHTHNGGVTPDQQAGAGHKTSNVTAK